MSTGDDCCNEKIEIIDSDILIKNEDLIVEFQKISKQLSYSTNKV